MVRNMPEGPRPESLHDQLVYLGDAERIRLRGIPELALRWLETLSEMGGLPNAVHPQRPETSSKIERVTVRNSISAPSFEDAHLERVMNLIRNGLGMRKGGDRRGAGQPENPHSNTVFTQVHNTLNTLCVVARRRFGSA